MTPAPDDPSPAPLLPVGSPREEEVRERLREVVDPELGDTIVDLGMVRAIREEAGRVTVDVALTIAACPLRTQIEKDVVSHTKALDWVTAVEVRVATMDADERAAVMARARWKAKEDAPQTAVPASARVLAIASGKGGVGKSSVTVNLAVALAARGHVVGVLDADIWGFSVPRLLGMDGDVEARAGKMVPLERRVGPGTLRVLSMGFLAEDEEQAIMWRGLVLNRAVQQFLQDAHWGDLDYLLIDLPPGHRRHPDGPGPAAAAHRAPGGDHAPGGRPEGGGPGGRHGPARLPAGGRRGREHERLHLRARHHLRALRLGRRRAPGPEPGRAAGRLHPAAPRPGGRRRRRGPGRPGRAQRARCRLRRAGPGGQRGGGSPPSRREGCTARMLEHVEAAVAQGEAAGA